MAGKNGSFKNVALLVAEAPWFLPKDNTGEASSLPFFEGVKKLLNLELNGPRFNVYKCNYYDEMSFEFALDHLIQTKEERQILYLGGHGDDNGEYVAYAELAAVSQLIRDRGKKIKGMILSSCWGGLNDSISESMKFGVDVNGGSLSFVNGPNWVVSYRCPVSWFESAMIETALIRAFSSAYIYHDINSKDAILDCLVDALSLFSIESLIGFDNEKLCIPLKNTIRVWVRPQGAEEPKDITEELVYKLGVLQEYKVESE